MSYKSRMKSATTHNLVRFCFFAQKGVFNFQNSKKTANHINCIAQKGKDSKKINIFEIGSLEVYDRGGGLPRVYTVLRPYMYTYIIYAPFETQKTGFWLCFFAQKGVFNFKI